MSRIILYQGPHLAPPLRSSFVPLPAPPWIDKVLG